MSIITQVDYIYIEDWCILTVVIGEFEMDVVKGIVQNGASINIEDQMLVISKQLEFFNAMDYECRAGGLFYKLGKPNAEWLNMLYENKVSIEDFNMGYRTDA